MVDVCSGRLVFGGFFGLTGDLCLPKISSFDVQSGRLVIALNA